MQNIDSIPEQNVIKHVCFQSMTIFSDHSEQSLLPFVSTCSSTDPEEELKPARPMIEVGIYSPPIYIE